MDTDTLVESRIDDGQKLVDELLRRGFDVAAAFWFKATVNEKWYFYIVSPLADSVGIMEAYRRLHPLVRAMPQPFGIDPLKITLIGPSDAIAQDVLAIQRRAPRAYGIRWGGKQLGDVSIDE